jgi:hypothetical protein
LSSQSIPVICNKIHLWRNQLLNLISSEKTIQATTQSKVPDQVSSSAYSPFLQSSFPCYKDVHQQPIASYSSNISGKDY